MAKLRLHVTNFRRKPAVYHITPERWAASAARHADAASRLEVSFGWDGESGSDAFEQVGIAIGVPADRSALSGRAPHLRWLHHTSAGVDALMPLDWLPGSITLTCNRGAHGVKAEQYVRMALSALNMRLPQIVRNQQAHRWEQIFSPSLVGQTALVIGLGDLGEGAARAARTLGMKVIGVRRSAASCDAVDEAHGYAALDAVLPQADYVVLAVPLTPETRNLLDRRRLALLKPTAGIVNIARAAVIDGEALREALNAGRVAGAVLDVASPEPLPADSLLWDTKNLILTPHVSCDDAERYVAISLDLWFENLARHLDGKPLLRRVDPRLGY